MSTDVIMALAAIHINGSNHCSHDVRPDRAPPVGIGGWVSLNRPGVPWLGQRTVGAAEAWTSSGMFTIDVADAVISVLDEVRNGVEAA